MGNGAHNDEESDERRSFFRSRTTSSPGFLAKAFPCPGSQGDHTPEKLCENRRSVHRPARRYTSIWLCLYTPQVLFEINFLFVRFSTIRANNTTRRMSSRRGIGARDFETAGSRARLPKLVERESLFVSKLRQESKNPFETLPSWTRVKCSHGTSLENVSGKHYF